VKPENCNRRSLTPPLHRRGKSSHSTVERRETKSVPQVNQGAGVVLAGLAKEQMAHVIAGS